MNKRVNHYESLPEWHWPLGLNTPDLLNSYLDGLLGINEHQTEKDRSTFIALLANSFSLSKLEKRRVIDSYRKLSKFQLNELKKVFEEEKEKFLDIQIDDTAENKNELLELIHKTLLSWGSLLNEETGAYQYIQRFINREKNEERSVAILCALGFFLEENHYSAAYTLSHQIVSSPNFKREKNKEKNQIIASYIISSIKIRKVTGFESAGYGTLHTLALSSEGEYNSTMLPIWLLNNQGCRELKNIQESLGQIRKSIYIGNITYSFIITRLLINNRFSATYIALKGLEKLLRNFGKEKSEEQLKKAVDHISDRNFELDLICYRLLVIASVGEKNVKRYATYIAERIREKIEEKSKNVDSRSRLYNIMTLEFIAGNHNYTNKIINQESYPTPISLSHLSRISKVRKISVTDIENVFDLFLREKNDTLSDFLSLALLLCVFIDKNHEIEQERRMLYLATHDYLKISLRKSDIDYPRNNFFEKITKHNIDKKSLHQYAMKSMKSHSAKVKIIDQLILGHTEWQRN